MKAKIRDTELFFDVLGPSIDFTEDSVVEKPTIFLLHGGPGSDHSAFKGYCPELQSVAQLVMMDHRGCGRSQPGDPQTYTLENNIEDIEALSDYLGLDKIIVYGHSYGGMVAQGYALKYPKRVAKLILGVTVSDNSFYAVARKNLKARGDEKQIVWGEKLLEGNFKNNDELRQFFIDMAPMYSNKVRREGISLKAFDNMLLTYEAINNGFGDFMQELNYTPDLHKIKCATLVFSGSDDWIFPPEFAEKIVAEIPNAQLKIFKNSGHSVPMDVHEEYIQTLKNFIVDGTSKN